MEMTAIKGVEAGIISNHLVGYTEDAADWVHS